MAKFIKPTIAYFTHPYSVNGEAKTKEVVNAIVNTELITEFSSIYNKYVGLYIINISFGGTDTAWYFNSQEEMNVNISRIMS